MQHVEKVVRIMRERLAKPSQPREQIAFQSTDLCEYVAPSEKMGGRILDPNRPLVFIALGS
jgi:hypothetical protein